MSNVSTTIRARLAQATTPTIYNLSMPLAGTEYSQAFSASTKKFLIRMRTNATAKIAFISGDTTLKYITIPPGNSYSEENLDLSGVILYIQSNQASQVAEILEWA